MDKVKEKIKFPFKCPVCGKSQFSDVDWLLEEDKEIESYEYDVETGKSKKIDAIEAHDVHCEYCGWVYDLNQVLDYNIIGLRNNKTINDLKKIYQDKLKENPNYNYDENASKPDPHKCPICGEYEFKRSHSYDLCPICGWIDDGTENFIMVNDYSEVNVQSISKAKENFIQKRKENVKYKFIKDNDLDI